MEESGLPDLNVGDGGISAVSVKLRGLPFKALEQDISDFFDGYNVQRALLKRYPDGRPNGEHHIFVSSVAREAFTGYSTAVSYRDRLQRALLKDCAIQAFVVFGNPEEALRACLKDREIFCDGDKFGDRYVRVYPTVESDLPDIQECLTLATSAQGQEGVTMPNASNQGDSVIKVKSLPYDACQLDVLQFFDGFRIRPNGVQLVIQGNNKPSGEAFVDFDSGAEAERAITTKDRQVFAPKFGHRYVRLVQVPRSEMQAALALRFGGDGIVKMKGLPFKATADDVIRFFAGYRVRPDGIHFVMHADGRPSGMAFVEFDCPQEAMRALSKDREQFGAAYGERFCLLQLVGRAELAKASTRRATPVGSANGFGMQNNMAAAAAALANSLGAGGMGNPGPNSNPLLSQYAALLGMVRQPGAGPGMDNAGAMAQLQALHQIQGMGGIQGQLAGLINNGGPAQSLGPPPNMMSGNHASPGMHGPEWMSQPQMPVNGHGIGMQPPSAGPPHSNMQPNMQPGMQPNMQGNMQDGSHML